MKKNVVCYKSAEKVNERECILSLTGEETLACVREMLVEKGFLPKEVSDKNDKGYRFIDKLSEVAYINYNDLIIPKPSEKRTECKYIMPTYRDELILTNIYEEKNADLLGFKADCWGEGYLTVTCELNQHDKDAIDINKGLFKPVMLSDVITTKAPKEGGHSIRLNNVCICCENSIVDFGLTSWGAAGYSFRAYPAAGEKIVEDLYITYNNSDYKTCIRTRIDRYQNHKNTIQIVGTDKLSNIVPGLKGSYHKIIFQSRRMTSYYEGFLKKKHTCHADPPSLKVQPKKKSSSHLSDTKIFTLQSVYYVPGSNIKEATSIPVGKSNTEIGTVWNPKTDSWDKALGTVEVYFFVFKTIEDAKEVIEYLNAPTWG